MCDADNGRRIVMGSILCLVRLDVHVHPQHQGQHQEKPDHPCHDEPSDAEAERTHGRRELDEGLRLHYVASGIEAAPAVVAG